MTYQDFIESKRITDAPSGLDVVPPFALTLMRKFIGIELKESYWKVACENLRMASESVNHQDLIGSISA